MQSAISYFGYRKSFEKILLHPGQFVLSRRIYRDCRGLDTEGALVRMNELVEEGLGSVVQTTQQQKVCYKALPTLDIKDSLRSHGINPDEYRAQLFEVDYKVIESQRNAIHNANPDRELVPLFDENHRNKIEEIVLHDNNSNDGDDDENSGGSRDDGNGEANSVNNDTSDGSGDETSNDNGTGGDSGDNGSGGDKSSDNGSGESEIVDNESDDNESGDHASDDNGNGSSIDDDSDDTRRHRNWAE